MVETRSAKVHSAMGTFVFKQLVQQVVGETTTGAKANEFRI